ncbi:MAG: AI-2E family transporter [Akkermansiaceae bacterium]|nr:AI-2E family transporter [Akkermansiaceae bacterium]
MSTETRSERPGVGRMLMIMACVVVIVAGLKAAQNFFLPVLLAFFVATVSFPVTDALTRRRVPRSIAVFLTVLVDFLFIAAVATLGIVLMQDLQMKWNTKYAGEFNSQVRTASVELAGKLDDWGVPDAQGKIQEVVENNLSNLRQIRFERIWDLGTGMLGHVMGFLGAVTILLILMVFMLSEAKNFGAAFEAIGKAHGPNFSRAVHATRDIQRYLAIKTVISLITGLLAGLLCWAAGLDFFILWGIVAFALNFIPVIGSLIAGIPPMILALLTAGLPNALLVGGGYLLINNFLGSFLEPIFVGRRFGISTLVVVVSVMFWGWVWGPFGMLLAVPLTMMIKVGLEGSREFHWIAVAMSAGKGEQRLAAEPATQRLEMVERSGVTPMPQVDANSGGG